MFSDKRVTAYKEKKTDGRDVKEDFPSKEVVSGEKERSILHTKQFHRLQKRRVGLIARERNRGVFFIRTGFEENIRGE